MKKCRLLFLLVFLVGCASISSPLVKVESHELHKKGDDTSLRIGSGTGFFVSRDGVIVTAAHVVEDNHRIFVYRKGRKVAHRAKLLVYDREADIAVLHIRRVRVHNPLRFCGNMQTGDKLSMWAWRGLGLERTRGLLIAPSYAGQWLSDAMVGPGFSGGPAFNDTRQCVAGVVVRSNMDSRDPLSILVRPEASESAMRSLRKHAPFAVRGL